MLALAQDLLAAGLALAVYAAGALPIIRPAQPLSQPSNDNEACHVRAASGR